MVKPQNPYAPRIARKARYHTFFLSALLLATSLSPLSATEDLGPSDLFECHKSSFLVSQPLEQERDLYSGETFLKELPVQGGQKIRLTYSVIDHTVNAYRLNPSGQQTAIKDHDLPHVLRQVTSLKQAQALLDKTHARLRSFSNGDVSFFLFQQGLGGVWDPEDFEKKLEALSQKAMPPYQPLGDNSAFEIRELEDNLEALKVRKLFFKDEIEKIKARAFVRLDDTTSKSPTETDKLTQTGFKKRLEALTQKVSTSLMSRLLTAKQTESGKQKNYLECLTLQRDFLLYALENQRAAFNALRKKAEGKADPKVSPLPEKNKVVTPSESSPLPKKLPPTPSKVVQAESADALYKKGLAYQSDGDGKDEPMAFVCYLQAAEQGHAVAQA